MFTLLYYMYLVYMESDHCLHGNEFRTMSEHIYTHVDKPMRQTVVFDGYTYYSLQPLQESELVLSEYDQWGGGGG